MKKDLLELDRLPTLDELKEFFKQNDWTSTKIDDPSKMTDEELAEIAYTAKLMDKKFEELVRKKGRNSAARYVGTSRARLWLDIITTMDNDACTDVLPNIFKKRGHIRNPQKELASAINAVPSKY